MPATILGVNRKSLLWFVASTTVYRVSHSTWFCFSPWTGGRLYPPSLTADSLALPSLPQHHRVPTSAGVSRGSPRVPLHPIPRRAETVKIKKETGYWPAQSCAQSLQTEATAALRPCLSSLAMSSEGQRPRAGTAPHSRTGLLCKTLSPLLLSMHGFSVLSLQYKQPLCIKRQSRLNCLRHRQEGNYSNQLVSVVKGGEGWSQIF